MQINSTLNFGVSRFGQYVPAGDVHARRGIPNTIPSSLMVGVFLLEGNMSKIEIKHRWNGEILFSGEFNTLKEATIKAAKQRADLSGADLSEANLSRANLSEADLSEADLSGANLSEADLSEADLSGANLYGANLSRANLSRANLSEANLYGADLSRADLSRANLSEANLYGADLSRADLSEANLSEADLSEADLSRADLSRADLSRAENYSESHDFFFELIRREKTDTFKPTEWAIIGQLAIHRHCWPSIKKRYGKKIVRIFKVLADKGFEEYADKYKEVLKED